MTIFIKIIDNRKNIRNETYTVLIKNNTIVEKK